MGISDRLKYGRERAKLTGAQVHERTGIGESSLSEFENGKREPSIRQLQSLADAYQCSIAFFLSTGTIPREVVLWRDRPPEAEAIEGKFLRLCEQYHNLEIWCSDRAPQRLPQAQGDPHSYGYPDAEALARRVRNELQLGDHPGPALLSVLEETCGIKVFFMPFQPTGPAASTVSETFGAAVLLNSLNRRWRRHFDLAHELFHLLTWNIFRSASNGTSTTLAGDEEQLAGCFARNLLMPVDAFRTAVNKRMKNGKVSFEAIFDIAREFDVSVEALLWQFHMIYRGPEDRALTEQEIERAKTLVPLYKESEESTPPPCLPARYHALGVRALRRGEMSTGRFAEYLGITRQEAMQYVEQETGDNEEIQVAPA